MRRRWAANGSPTTFLGWLKKAEQLYITGTPKYCAEQLHEHVDLGVRLFVIRFGDLPSLDGLRLFTEEVVPMIWS